jgi:lipid-A-disaccharide synthase
MIKAQAGRQLDSTRNPNLVALFPGSRFREVRKIFPVMLQASREICAQRPGTHFEVAAVSETLAAEIQQQLLKSSLPRDKVRVGVGENSAIMQRACVGIIASGTATLEAAYFRLPFVLVYKVSLLTYLAARLVVRVKYLGMPNVLADRQVVPEFIQHRAKPNAIAKAVLELMTDSSARTRMISEFDTIVAKLGARSASQEAAQAILQEIEQKEV